MKRILATAGQPGIGGPFVSVEEEGGGFRLNVWRASRVDQSISVSLDEFMLLDAVTHLIHESKGEML